VQCQWLAVAGEERFKMKLRLLAIVFVTQCLGLSAVFGQSSQQTVRKVDVDSVLQNLLIQYDMVPVTRKTTVNVPYKDCWRGGTRSGAPGPEVCKTNLVAVEQSKTTQEYLSVSNLQFVSSAMSFGAVTQTTLPDRLVAASEDVCNPYQITGSQSATYSQQIQHTESETLTHTITSSISDAFNATVKVNDDLTLSNTITIGTQDAHATADLTGNALTQTLQLQVTQQIPMQSRYGLEFLVTPTQFSVPYTLTVKLDGQLSQNDAGLTMLSQVLNEADRTFVVEGIASTEIGLKAHARFVQLEFDQIDCPKPAGQTAGLIVKPLVLKPDQKVTDPQPKQ
jgi:hypothetical protein